MQEEFQPGASLQPGQLRALDERGWKRFRGRGNGPSGVCGLAEPAGGVVLAAGVNMAGRECDKDQGANGQAERQKNSGVPPRAPVAL